MTNNTLLDDGRLTLQEQKIITIISEKLGDTLQIIKIQNRKARARARKLVIAQGARDKYFIELASSRLQKFYFKRSLRNLRLFSKLMRYVAINQPLLEEEIDGSLVAVFPYLTGISDERGFSAEWILKDFYDNHSVTKKMSPETLAQIEKAFLASCPPEYHFFIQNLPEYIDYWARLKNYPEIVLCTEHGDFAPNNILNNAPAKYLIDFEFSREFQPAGFDLYYYNLKTHKCTLWWREKYYYKELHEAKLQLIERINFAIDYHFTDLIVYPQLSAPIIAQINSLLQASREFDGKPLEALFSDWNSRNNDYFFVTFWEEQKITAFAAFKKVRNTLSLLVTDSNIPLALLSSTKQLTQLLTYLDKSRLGIRIDAISKESGLYNYFMAFSNGRFTDDERLLQASSGAASSLSPSRPHYDLAVALKKIQIVVDEEYISVHNKHLGKTTCKFFIERGVRIFRQGSRCVRTLFNYFIYKAEIKKLAGFLYHYPKIRLRWRKSRKKGGALLLRVGGFSEFIAALNRNKIDYVVLRGLKNDGAPGNGGDIDFLLNASQIQKVIKIAAFFPGKTPCDFYFDTMQSVECYPYYPPCFALKVLEHKTINNFGCFVPNDHYCLLSLLYHVTYHKGLASGFEVDGCRTDKKNKYYDLIAALARVTEQEHSLDMSLIGFHNFLKKAGCNMPYDLLVKWPKRHAFIDSLRDQEKKELLADLPWGLDDLVIFVIREDARESAVVEYIRQEISKKLTVLFFEKLTRDQIDRAVQLTRGGNWIEQDKKMFQRVEPHYILICRFKNLLSPTPESGNEGEYNRHLTECSAIKNNLRQKINEKFPAKNRRYALHGSDSICESIDYLRTIYPDSYQEMLRKVADPS